MTLINLKRVYMRKVIRCLIITIVKYLNAIRRKKRKEI